jgi:hypothetical protein
MVEGNFKYSTGEAKQRKEKRFRHNHRFGFMDPLMLMALAASSQPLGLWILKYILDEVESVTELNYIKILYAFMIFLVGLISILVWYKFSREG